MLTTLFCYLYLVSLQRQCSLPYLWLCDSNSNNSRRPNNLLHSSFLLQVFHVTRVCETWVSWKIATNFLCNSSSIKNNTPNLNAIFQRTQVLGTRVTQKTRISQSWVPKEWYINIYLKNSGRFLHILPNSGIW